MVGVSIGKIFGSPKTPLIALNMKTLIKILCLFSLSIIFSQTDNQNKYYTLKVKNSNNKIDIIENVHFTKKTLLTYIFESESGRFEFRKKDIISIYDSNNNNISIDQLIQFKSNDFNSYKEINSNSNQESLLSAAQYMKNFRNYYYFGTILVYSGMGLQISSDGEDNIGNIVSLIGGLLTLYSVGEIGKAGEELQKIEIKD